MAVITVQDCRELKYCLIGIKRAFNRYGLSKQQWREFIDNGIDEESLAHINDAMIDKAITHARKRECNEQ